LEKSGKIAVMVYYGFFLSLSASHDQNIISQDHYSWKVISPLVELAFKFFWRKAYSKWHSQVLKLTKEGPVCGFNATFLVKADLVKTIFGIQHGK